MSSILDVRAWSKVHQLWNSCRPYLVSPWLSSQSSQFQEMAWRPAFTKQLSPNHSQSISVLKTQSALSGSAPELPLKHPIHVPSQSQDSMFAELLTLRMSADSTPSFPAPWWHPQDSVSHQRQDRISSRELRWDNAETRNSFRQAPCSVLLLEKWNESGRALWQPVCESPFLLG